ncbi:EAL domain-containing protein [Janthinobacterium psychrotolerans]|uniref:EAL domain, c-di-GMP-specific phosphodiesterase class I (Or its enzymatically inactive variant) n=1 Tax=Janthinobacterium psychrotolerans TaxID=1747903 RepID=A0A1A7C5A5_9BURK|nr:EAL domain-containing protein [Janthinobacterium psychrotolerans]OBV40892.1 EAL domain, c-di-GMP-specific phosphodiesterase class I (or its enzymatically inactive variant) [Janthinobacterium psychrotolerans]
MPFPVLNNYLARLSHQTQAGTSVWRDQEGRALGRFFNCTMTSAFQPLRELGSGEVLAYEGLARSVSKADQGLSLWRLLDHAASDDESVELDRLCRMLHAINFFRQPEAEQADLYLNVHDRLLSAVSSNHGHAFQRILDALGLPIARIVLQLPAVTANQSWLLNYVADNYRRNGFRLAIHAGSVNEAIGLLERLHPHSVKLDAGKLGDEDAAAHFVTLCHAAKIRVVFKRLDTPAALQALQRIAAATGLPIVVQGYLLDKPLSLLAPAGVAAPRIATAA